MTIQIGFECSQNQDSDSEDYIAEQNQIKRTLTTASDTLPNFKIINTALTLSFDLDV